MKENINKLPKKSKYPEWYIGRPKAMKVKKEIFHKPTKWTYIKLGVLAFIVAFIAWIVFRLVQVGKIIQPKFEYYEFNEDKQPANYILENSRIRFELDSLTTQFSITQKDTGKVWYSNPLEAKKDPVALAKEKYNMMSPLLIKYSTENGTDDVYDIFTNSIERKFYTISKNGNEVKVNYTIGQMEREYIFPPIMYQSDIDKWGEGLTKSQLNAIYRAYHKYTASSFKTQSEYDAMLAKYPRLEEEPLYLVFENIQKFMKEQMESTFEKQGYTYEDYEKDKALYKESSFKEMPTFNITVVYKLDENGFTVSVPLDEIAYRLKYPIIQISVLPYFGASGRNDEGFMLIPEGGGSIINFNNGKTKQNGYYADCYGWDYATDRKAVITETRASYPVFGMAYDDSSFIAVIKEGAEYAGITAEISGKLGSYNYVRADYKMLHREQFDVSTQNINAQFSYEPNLPKGETLVQKFLFVDSGSYVDMAIAYREELFGKNAKKVNNKDVPVSVEILGAIEKVQQVAGMPKTKPYKLTSYSEAEKIISDIENLGIDNVSYKLTGFVNGGIRQKLMNKLRFISVLGGKSDFKKLVKESNEKSRKLYLDASVQTTYRTGFFGGFNRYSDSARFTSDELCELNEYSSIWYGKDKERDSYYLLNLKKRSLGEKVLLKNAKKYNFGISYRDNGYLLSSDFNDRNITTRQAAKKAQTENMEKIKSEGLGLMVNGGNDYSVKYADFITNIPLHGNAYAIIDKSVPFYQIALHGYVNYAGSSVNLGFEKDQIILESAESGAGLAFTFMNAKSPRLQETSYTEYYSSNFDMWKEQMSDIYEKYNKQMARVINSPIKNHQYVSEQVTKTTFENDYAVYVNFGYKGYMAEEGFIPERSFRVLKVEE